MTEAANMSMPTTISTTISMGLVFRCIGKAILYYNVIGMLLAAVVATHQEAKIWKNNGKNSKKKSNTRTNDLVPLSVVGHVKVFLFNLCWYLGCLLGSIYISIQHIVTLGKSDIGYQANRLVEAAVANFVVQTFVGNVEIIGQEHLQSIRFTTSTSNDKKPTTKRTIPAPIFVANHCSQLDIGAVYRIFENSNNVQASSSYITTSMRFKWIAKHSVLYLPGVGPLMWLGDHVLIYRRPPSSSSSPSSSAAASSNRSSSSNSNNSSQHKASVAQLFAKSNEALQQGIAMFLFPQGTRRMTRGSTGSSSTDNDDDDDAHLPFKDGAFIMAEDNGSPLIPISIIIPRDNSCWNSWYPFFHRRNSSATTTPTIRLVIHEPIMAVVNDGKTPQKRTKEELKQLCYNAIYSVNVNSGGSGSGGTSGGVVETAKNK